MGVRRFAAGTCWVLLALVGALHAYPPAPGTTLTGVVRDEYGWVLRDEGAEVVVRQGDVEIGRARIVNDVSFGFNYRVNLPVDSNVSPEPYRPGALLATSSYNLEIHVNGVVYLPIETLAGGLPAPQQGGIFTVDLTLGEDSDGDGLPDDWEYWQLQVIGIYPGNPLYDLDQLGAPGDYDRDGISDTDEYLAGTIATLGLSRISFDIQRVLPPGTIEFTYNAVVDKAYVVESSIDGETWAPVPISVDDPLSPAATAWTATQTGERTVYGTLDQPTRLFRLRSR